MRVAGVVFATHSAAGGPAALSPLGGRPMVVWGVSALAAAGTLDQVVVVVAGGAADSIGRALDGLLPSHCVLVVGGAPTRHESLHHVLSILDSSIEMAVLHDACRPLAPPAVVSRVVSAVEGGAPAAVPVVEVTETVKELDEAGRVGRTVPRESLVRVQAPQAVRRSLLDAAHAGCGAADLTADDDGALVPAGFPVQTVPGDHAAFPVLHPADLALAEAVLVVAGRPGRR
jgi:2-C-methyl-D-erythritol 4-phosphate cytidylyltransferase